MYETEEECGIESSKAGCYRQCRWLGGGLASCIIKWDFHFDVCFVVDASESINPAEWDSIRLFFIKEVVKAIAPLTCDLNNVTQFSQCPHVGVVQFDVIAQTIIPDLTQFGPQYTESSQCLMPDVTLSHLEPNWETTIDGMKRSLDQNRPGGDTWTLYGVQRCSDLLLNTYRANPKTLSLMLVMTDGDPNGPTRCLGEVCSICGVNPEKRDAIDRIPGFMTPDCSAGQFVEVPQSAKIREANVKTVIIEFKTDVIAFKAPDKLLCILGINLPLIQPIKVPSTLLQNASDPRNRQLIGQLVTDLSNLVCDFLTASPTMAPTLMPSMTPSSAPTSVPTVAPSRSPTFSPTNQPTQTPTNSPTGSPTLSPTRNPTKSPSNSPTSSPSRDPTRFPSNSPTKSPSSSPSSSPSDSPTNSPTFSPSKDPTRSPSKNPSNSPTLSPSQNPTLSPTMSPTICRGPPRDYVRGNCDANTCAGTNAIVNVLNGGAPVLSTDTNAQTTQFCWRYRFAGPSSGFCSNAQALVGLTFIMDECCPDRQMDFVDAVQVSSTSFTRATCPMENELNAFRNGCVRTTRQCVSRTHQNDLCTVINLNGLNVANGQGQYCVTIAGTNFERGTTGELRNNLMERAKICFERRDTRNVKNLCSCMEVGFVTSRRICGLTSNPSMSPTRSPSASPSLDPTKSPTKSPTSNPTFSPSKFPTKSPSNNPTNSPTRNPTNFPTTSPSQSPTKSPTKNPTARPSISPSQSPTRFPTDAPTQSPSQSPTKNPTTSPTENPSNSPTQTPSNSPTKSPTFAPTQCRGPPPNYIRSNCAAQCNAGSSQVVQVNPTPIVTTDLAMQTTEFCWRYTLLNPSGGSCSNVGTTSLVGVSFVMDECCPDGQMDFVQQIDVFSSSTPTQSFPRGACPMDLTGTRAFDAGCVRTRRQCASPTQGNSLCSVVNLNGIDLRGNGQYCLVMSGTNFEGTGTLTNRIRNGLVDVAKMCFERGSTRTNNYCSCVDVEFVTSRDICQDTSHPTASPTRNPTTSPSGSPSRSPTSSPTRGPSRSPTSSPSDNPTRFPSNSPTFSPSKDPTLSPSGDPTRSPTETPTTSPSPSPTRSPSENPTNSPTKSPSRNPSRRPTKPPSQKPTRRPTDQPTASPTDSPSDSPTLTPTSNPTTCTGPPPDYTRQKCSANTCTGGNNVVSILNNGRPIVITKPNQKVTEFCWTYSLTNPSFGFCSNANAQPIIGVSFVMDECCPDGQMDFVDVVTMSSLSYPRSSCAVDGSNTGNAGSAFANGCVKTRRQCASRTHGNDLCSVINLNGIDVNQAGEFCLTMAGTGFEDGSTARIKNDLVDVVKICFERGSTTSSGNNNYCTCLEVEFVTSRNICRATSHPSMSPTFSPTESPSLSPIASPTISPSSDPTKSPTDAPTISPTISPTRSSDSPTSSPTKQPTNSPTSTPTGTPTVSPTPPYVPPPSLPRGSCVPRTCDGPSNSSVKVTLRPQIETDVVNGFTTFCYNFTIEPPPPPFNPSCRLPVNATMRGISFMIDECCPSADMDALLRIRIGEQEYSANQCRLEYNSSRMFDGTGCVRGMRPCTKNGSIGQQCSVINVNGMNEKSSSSFCVTVAGTNWNRNNMGRIDFKKRRLGKICFENGVSTTATNVCSCMEVEVPSSEEICRFTRAPAVAPTVQPTARDCAAPEPVWDRSCRHPCSSGLVAEWNPFLAERSYDNAEDVTMFRYCVNYDRHWYQKSNACIARNKKTVSEVTHVHFRLDSCCSLCLVGDHFYHYAPGKITNGDSSPYFKIDDESSCYTFLMHGDIGTANGLMCVKGATKCACTRVEVPSSCDLKHMKDVSCDRDDWTWKGGSSSRRDSGRSRSRSSSHSSSSSSSDNSRRSSRSRRGRKRRFRERRKRRKSNKRWWQDGW